MKEDENFEDRGSRKRLRRKVLERWENEGGRIRTEPGITPQRGRPLGSGTERPVRFPTGSVNKHDSGSSD